MKNLKVKLKMNLNQLNDLYSEYFKDCLPKHPYMTFETFLDKKFSKIIDSKIDEDIKNAECEK